jgi:hypothetical protein
MSRPRNLWRRVVLTGLGAVALLIANVWARQRAMREAIIDAAVAVSSNDFARPAHRGDGGSGTVTACLDAVFAAVDGGVPKPALPLGDAIASRLLDGGSAWLERTRVEVTLARRCLEAPAVGPFDAFGTDGACGATAHLSRSRVLREMLVWLRAEASSLVPDAAPLDACLDVTALERDTPVYGGTGMVASAGVSARLTVDPCVRALVRATPAERERALQSLEGIRSGVLPLSTVLRLDGASVGVSFMGNVLRLSTSPRLPEAARACAGVWDPGPSVRQYLEVWLVVPSLWHRLRRLEEVSRVDPRLESSAAKAILNERFLFHDMVIERGRLARALDTLARKTATLLAVIAALEGQPVPTPPWMKLGLTPTDLHLEVELDEGWMTIDVER